MRLGALLLPVGPWATARESWMQVEELGFDIGYTADHLTHPTMAGQWWADGWTTVAAAAGVTTTLELGTLVASAAFRSPIQLARLASTVQDVSDGRFVLGLGAGLPGDALADRGNEPTPRELAGRFSDTIHAVRAAWSGTSEWRGGQASFAGVDTLPQAPGRTPPPLVIAAHGPRGFGLVAECADGWSTFGGRAAAGLEDTEFWALVARQAREVDRACAQAGRDPGSVTRSVLLGWGAGRPLRSGDALVDALDTARRVGFDELVVYWPTGQPGDRFWADLDVVRAGVAMARAAGF